MQPVQPTVFVVEDDKSVREALSSLIRSAGLYVASFDSPRAFMRSPRPEAPSCLVLDVRLPEFSGLELQRQLASAGDPIPIIFITGHGDIAMSVGAMKAGAAEFLTKPFADHELLDAVNQALERDRVAREQRAELGRVRRRQDSLTAREREVLRGVVAGKLNKQIAATLGVSEITVKVHRRRVMQKMGARSVAQLVRMVERLSQP